MPRRCPTLRRKLLVAVDASLNNQNRWDPGAEPKPRITVHRRSLIWKVLIKCSPHFTGQRALGACEVIPGAALLPDIGYVFRGR